MQTRTSMIVFSSFLLTAAVSWLVYNKKKQFYPTIVFLTNNQTCFVILLFQCAVLLFLFARLFIKLFFGQLQQIEVDNLVSQSWYAFFDMCLVFAFFQDELGMDFLFMFSILLLVRIFHWLIEERVDYLERTPAIGFLFHLRVLSLIFLLAIVDIYFIYNNYMNHKRPVHIALGVEYYNLLFNLVSITLRYFLHSIDSMREHPWDKKTMYLLYIDIIIGIVRLSLYTEFAMVMWKLHPFPLFVVRPIYLSIRSLKKSIQDVLLSRRAIRYMNTVFSNATGADLQASSDTVCIICREEMQLPESGTPSQQNLLKKLPCSHIFHATCLRSWLQRQQTCPTCRMDIIQQARQQEMQNQRQNPVVQNEQSSGPAVSSASSTASTSSASRPYWTPPGYFPPYMGWPPTANPPITSQSSSGPNPFGSVPAPFFSPPVVGMPIIYPGQLFPTPTLPMPSPPSSGPIPTSESQLRANAEARFVALRQINVLLNAAVLQMNAYLNAVTDPMTESEQNPWLLNFGPNPQATDPVTETSETQTTCATTDQINSTASGSTAKEEPVPNHSDVSSSVRQKRLERFVSNQEDNPKSD